MGLDMYLYAKKFVSGVDYTRNADGGYDRWENTDLDTIASIVGLERGDLDEDNPHAVVELKVGQWRKANQVHQWFVDNVQDGEDNCKEYYVSREDLAELRNTCRQVLAIRARQEANPDQMLPGPDDILPVSEGFFFGNYEYDEYYYEQVQYTYNLLDRLLSNEKFKEFDFAYDSSW